MKKKILITAFNLDVGGVEKCLVNLVNKLDTKKYDIKIILQVKEGIFLNEVKKEISVEGYNFCKIKNKILKKITNILIYLKVLIKNYKKYDYSICYAPGYIPSSILALISSKKQIAWMHTNLLIYMNNYEPYKNKIITTEQKVKKFVNRMFFRKYKKNIFVSEDALKAYLKVYPQDKNKCEVIYNIIDSNTIRDKSKEKINLKKEKIFTFVNVGRHTEFDKRVSRIIEASKKLLNDNLKFKVLLIGDGPDNNYYKKIVKQYKLDNNVEFLGKKANPYPYFLLGDTFILSSEFEGLPTTVMEALVLKLPIISTNVSDVKKLVDKKFGNVINNEEELYLTMKKYINNGYKNKKYFDYEEFNKKSINKVERMLNNE